MDWTTTQGKIKEIQKDNNYPGFEKLVKLVKAKYKDAISRKEVKDFLDKDLPTQLYTTQQKQDAPGHIVAFRQNDLWQMDIFVMKKGLAKYNDDYRYLFVCIDVFSRKAYAEPMKEKNTDNCIDAFLTIVKDKSKAWPNAILADQDSAFNASDWQDLMTGHKIAFSTNALQDHHALGIIDRFARVVKTVLNKQMQDEGSRRWLDNVDYMMDNYNNSEHSSIGNHKPDEVKDDATQKTKNIITKIVGINLGKTRDNNTTSDLHAGDKVRKDVRVSESNSKGTDPRWSDKVFTAASSKGQTITLDDGSKYKRTNLLKVPPDTESTETNVIQRVKNQQSKEARNNRIKIKVLQIRADKRAEKKRKEDEAKKKAADDVAKKAADEVARKARWSKMFAEAKAKKAAQQNK